MFYRPIPALSSMRLPSANILNRNLTEILHILRPLGIVNMYAINLRRLLVIRAATSGTSAVRLLVFLNAVDLERIK